MTMDSLTKKTLDVSRSLTYTYYTHPPSRPENPTVLCIHGFPDEAAEWADLATTHLIPAGYGVIAVDCLGYAGTSKPLDPALYAFEHMTKDLAEILDNEKIQKVVSLGHDWGCSFAQRFYNYHPDRVLGLVMINVAYNAPGDKAFDLDAANEMSKKLFGYATQPYWYLFSSEDGYKLLDEHLESCFTVLHGPPESWLDTTCKYDGLKDYLIADKKQQTEAYATEEMMNAFITRFKRDGFAAPTCWYKAIVGGHQNFEAKKVKAMVVEVPSLYIGFDNDKVCRPELINMGIKNGFLPKLTNVKLEGGHWGLLANADKFGKTIVDWLKKEFDISRADNSRL
ncbi:alpha/beta-hydrolase [Aureobasidium pullulans]|uniref:Alpha/beta-hydrolase n=1 Tax=Aureobasidium pullulans TaxID=5580 RepID=A0A4S9ZSV7_AURPU|nr:alpha/beta-hydrolase [Aureobasidium pullulans]TIA10566.1 alpha/beta-hydrolase [Aureobasidium pullulans]